MLSLMMQQRHMFSEDPVIMQKGAGLGLLKRDPMKEELLDRQGDFNRQIGDQGKASKLQMGERHSSVKGAQPDSWRKLLVVLLSSKRALPPHTTLSTSLPFSF